MAISYVWKVVQMDCIPQEGQYTDVVVNVHWSCLGTDSGASSNVYGTHALPSAGDPFTDYEDLTESQVLDWCWDTGLDKTAVEASVALAVDSILNPPIVTPPLPW